jgi:hypothetical protein
MKGRATRNRRGGRRREQMFVPQDDLAVGDNNLFKTMTVSLIPSFS